MRQYLKPALLPVLAATCLAGLSAPAMADDVTIRIDLSGLDAANPSDDAAIRDRIKTAVPRACNRATGFHTGLSSWQECQADGQARALEVLEARRNPAEG
ncbi:conserved hypothetical protein [Altererythrobacter sp. B11]|uniref:UrcA family protein n=1 Tax=Altererythrobacter sp. B11 TaxID=2060312 RepID=UPI000DC70FB6|nr:UrcA family protein [Altererythrobacter sp. B11]BBC71142.1 conserved hypothetical protein [Altererythrobacter sp. B11]